MKANNLVKNQIFVIYSHIFIQKTKVDPLLIYNTMLCCHKNWKFEEPKKFMLRIKFKKTFKNLKKFIYNAS